ncbi:radical SAM protein [Clostridiaceae bacterium]|nr:radical SAM protein [Clostridiaceae bacterium]RKI16912.1 radical SAM protein [bacterium 1XD21-70]
MIVNRYNKKTKLDVLEDGIYLYVLWKVALLLKNVLTIGQYEKIEKWLEREQQFKHIKRETEEWLKKNHDTGKIPMFSSIEIEVINRCNGICPFCPVNRNTDPRKLKKMDEALFKRIVDELGEIKYSGRLALHSNNEPFLDSRIIEFTKYAREHVPHAHLYMYTNGTLLTMEKFKAIIPFLDRIVIDNYDDELKLIENVAKIHEYCQKDRKLNRKVEIHVRKIHEVLNTRGGQSPNNKKKEILNMSCILPYKQMVVRPDGKTSLCCNDPYGKYTLADLNKMSLREAWYTQRYEVIRKKLRKGRNEIKLCKYCDTLPGPKGY